MPAAAGSLAFPRAEAAGLRLREAGEADLPFMAALYASTRREELAPVPWSEADKRAFLAQQFEAQHRHYAEHYPYAARWIVERKGEPIGRLYLDALEGELRIVDIALVEAARGEGLGTAVLRDVMDAAARGRLAVGIHVETTNPAMTLYRRLGFARIENKGVYDLMRWMPGAGAGAGRSVS